jgi:hypothetical protein
MCFDRSLPATVDGPDQVGVVDTERMLSGPIGDVSMFEAEATETVEITASDKTVGKFQNLGERTLQFMVSPCVLVVVRSTHTPTALSPLKLTQFFVFITVGVGGDRVSQL